MVARLRHIALRVSDPDESARMFEEVFGMWRVGRAPAGVYMTDGTVNIALLSYPDGIPGFPKDQDFYGVTHFGMWVDDLHSSIAAVEEHGCQHLMGDPHAEDVFYEVKYTDRDGIVFDLTHGGWRGAVKEVVPAPVAEG